MRFNLPTDDTSQGVSDQRDTTTPLCVDLDGTLLRSDMLLESLLAMIKDNPASVFQLPFWMVKGKAHFKSQIASRVDFSSCHLPFNEEVVEYVLEQRASRRTVLVTGTHQSLAEAVANSVDLFDEVIGSTSETNLTSHRKRDLLQSRFGVKGFDYIGNDKDDLNVWPAAREAMVVSAPTGIASYELQTFERIFNTKASKFSDYLSLLRVHQWSKNALIAVPFFLDHRINDVAAFTTVVLAFVAMSMLSSATYIFNDMLDLQADRQNDTKCKRALASGAVTIPRAAQVIAGLVVLLLIVTSMLPTAFNGTLFLYLITTLTYSLLLKKKAMVDIITIAALHTLRVVAGILVIQAAWSFWLLGFSMFFFFSLASAKRVAELINLQQAGRQSTVGRDYQTADIPVMLASGVSTGFISIMIVALYINSEKVQTMYANPMILWLLCPVLMYWVGRIWIYTARGQMHEDPIVFAMTDRGSKLTALTLASILIAAMLQGTGAL